MKFNRCFVMMGTTLWIATFTGCSQAMLDAMTATSVADFKRFVELDRRARLTREGEMLAAIRNERKDELEEEIRTLRKEFDAKAREGLESQRVRIAGAEAIGARITGLIENHTRLAYTVSEIGVQLAEKKIALDELKNATEESKIERERLREASKGIAHAPMIVV